MEMVIQAKPPAGCWSKVVAQPSRTRFWSCEPCCLVLCILECHLLALALIELSSLEAAALGDESSRQTSLVLVIIMPLTICIDHYINFFLVIAFKDPVHWQRPRSGRRSAKVMRKKPAAVSLLKKNRAQHEGVASRTEKDFSNPFFF